MTSFSARIEKIGINPYVLLPDAVLQSLFEKAGRDKGPIPVRLTIEKQSFLQHLVRYSGLWRLYLNAPMLKAAGKNVGGIITLKIAYDTKPRQEPVSKDWQKALDENPEAAVVFESLAPSHKKEIIRYLNRLKSEEVLARNIGRAIGYLLGKERFVGRAPVAPTKRKL